MPDEPRTSPAKTSARPLAVLSTDRFNAATGTPVSAMLSAVFASAWAMRPDVLENMMGLLVRHDSGVRVPESQILALVAGRVESPSAAVGRGDDAAAQRGYVLRDGIAVVPIGGVIAKHASQVNGASQPQGTSIDQVRAVFGAALRDPDVRGVMLYVDSPGGSTAGVKVLADEVRAAAERGELPGGRPVWLYSDDLLASAAYWFGSQASRVLISSTGEVGSIGVYAVVADTSRAADRQGVTVHMVRSAPFKGVGTPGVPIDGAGLGSVQRRIDALHGAFVADVARGRNVPVEDAAAWATGDVKTGAEAVAAGLADGIVRSAEEAVALLAEHVSKKQATHGGTPRVAQAARGRPAASLESDVSLSTPSFARTAVMPDNPTAPPLITLPEVQSAAAAALSAAGAGPQPQAGPPAGSDAAAIAAERARAADIDHRAELYPGNKTVASLAARAKSGGWSVEKFSDEVLKAQVAYGGPTGHVPRGGDASGIEIVADAQDKRRSAYAMMLAVRANPGLRAAAQEPSRAVRTAEIMGFDSPDLFRKAMRGVDAEGIAADGLLDIAAVDVARVLGIGLESARRMALNNPIKFMAAVGHTSSDFPLITSDAANKAAAGYFAEMPQTWDQFCGTMELRGYKPQRIIQLSEAQNMELIPTGQTPSEATFNERMITISGEDFARRLTLSHKLIINDELGMFTDALSALGKASYRVPENLVYGLLNLNSGAGPLQPDGQPFFHANRKNRAASAGALSPATINLAYIGMRKQTGFGNDKAPLDIQPKVLLVPVALAEAAEDIYTQEYTPGTEGAQNKRNNNRGKYRPVDSPRLLSDTGWYLFGDPAMAPVIRVGFGNNQRTPRVDVIPQHDPLSITYQISLLNVGVAMSNPEAGWFNAGT